MGLSDLFSRVGVVLLRPKSPGNVGSVARAMKNMGFSRLIVAEPMRYENPGYFDDEARRMAWQAADLLDSRRIEPDLGTALSTFDLVIGTSSAPPGASATLAPREVAAVIAARLGSATGSNAALLFGQEDIGLTREHLSRCHMVGTIPVSSSYPSLNLSQAALVFLYELRLALLEAGMAPPIEPGADPRQPAPAHAQLEAFYSRLERALDEIDFFQGTARASMMRELRLILNRALLTSRELAILEGVVHRILWAARRHG